MSIVRSTESTAERQPVLGRREPTKVPDSPRAWLVVAAAFTAGFVVFGITYSFGVFLEPIATEFHVSRAATSALFSITGLVFYFSGAITGRLSDRFGPAIVVGAGAVLTGASLVFAAFLHQLWIIYIVYGVGVGLGAACVYVPTLALVGGWFERRRTTALGIAAAGTGCGMLVLPIASSALNTAFGWRTAFMVLGVGGPPRAMLTCLATVVVAAAASASVERVVEKCRDLLHPERRAPVH